MQQADNALARELTTYPCRPLWAVLATELANTSIRNQDRHALLGRLFRSMSPVDQLRCRDELHWSRMAKRGAMMASVI